MNPKLDKEMKKQEKMVKIIEKFSCKKPVYENCRILAPDGEMLCFCDYKKMNWYLERDLAEIIIQNPPTFKLKFEPNSRGCIDEGNVKYDFYTVDRRNRCVICGFDKNYMRFYIIPLIYRQYLPNFLKSHKSHDVLLLCFSCHEKSNKLYDIKKKELAEQYKCPINCLSEEQMIYKQLLKVKNSAEIMLKNLKDLPLERKNYIGGEIFDIIFKNKNNSLFEDFFLSNFEQINLNERRENISDKNFINVTNIRIYKFPETVDDLDKQTLKKITIYDLKKYQLLDKKNLHGKIVMEKVENYEEFIKSWRMYFLDVMKPKCLPDAWNINHQFRRTFGECSKFSKGEQN